MRRSTGARQELPAGYGVADKSRLLGDRVQREYLSGGGTCSACVTAYSHRNGRRTTRLLTGRKISSALPVGVSAARTTMRVTHPRVPPDPAFGLLKLYDDALPHVYGYLLARCGDTGLAEDLTSESFPAAVHAVRKPGAPDPSIPWLIGVARHKLADHWRRVGRVAPAGLRAGTR
jgi:Sigma-70 region 2